MGRNILAEVDGKRQDIAEILHRRPLESEIVMSDWCVAIGDSPVEAIELMSILYFMIDKLANGLTGLVKSKERAPPGSDGQIKSVTTNVNPGRCRIRQQLLESDVDADSQSFDFDDE
jgi:hypothetical protein